MVESNKHSSKEKYKDKNNDKNKKKQRKLFLTGSDENPIFNTRSLGRKYTDTLILIGDKIQGKNVPNAAKGKFFKYNVSKQVSDRKKFKIHFMYQAIELEGKKWIELRSNEEDKIMKKVELQLVDKGKELYIKAHGRIQKAKRDTGAEARKTIKTINFDEEEELCFNDIDEAVKYHSNKSKEAFELLYELVEDSEKAVIHKSNKRQWKHTVTGDKMFEYTQKNNKENWDTGRMNKFLKDRHKRHKESMKCAYIHVVLRTKHLFAFQTEFKPTPKLKDGMSLYTSEEYL